MDVEGVPGMVALAVPLVLMALVMVRYILAERRMRNAPPRPLATGRYGAPVGGRRHGAPATLATVANAVERRMSVEEVQKALSDAKARGNEQRLTAMQVELARYRIEAGRTDEASELLRTAIRTAVRLDLAVEQAAARLELGDLAQASGDLTSACEHWQMARALYFEKRRSADLARVEKRMSASSCPTDWVLNDF